MNSHSAVRILIAPFFAALALLLATMQTPNVQAGAVTYFVDNTGDSNAASICDSNVAGDCSLRQAINRANAVSNVDQDIIAFSIGNAMTVPTITFLTAPPPITQLLRIDGGTAPANRVELRGIVSVTGLLIRSSNVAIHKLALNGFAGGDGLFVDGVPAPISNITLSENRIGIGKTADTDEGNAGDGIEVRGSVTNLTIRGSVIGNNNEYGIRFTNVFTGPNTIESSNIGVTVGGADHGNGLGGILATGQVTIGGVGSNRNYISGNTGSGIVLSGTTDAIVEGNSIGLSSLDTVVPNTLHGIRVSSPGDAAIRNNAISGNLMHGVLLTTASGTYLGGNYIGLSVFGSLERPNGQDGIHIMGTSDNIHIGDISERNIISGNEESGIDIESGADAIEIIGNRIGTEYKGITAVPNDAGITSAGTDVLIDENLLSGNAAYGVDLPGGSGAVLMRNYIGTNVTATAVLANGDTGVRINSPGNKIGDGPVADRNIISGNFYGIAVGGPGGNFIENNYIGTNLAGTGAIPNHIGIRINAPSIVGSGFGDNTSLRNVISGNTSTAIDVGGSGGVLIRNNIIGQRADFAGPLPNDTGILLASSDNGVYNNIIDGNTATGVAVDFNGRNNGIANNEIHNNGDLGVDLDWDGPTQNDTNDPDTGGNNLQNFPVVVAAYPTKLHWTLDTVPGESYIITAVIAEGGCDPSGFGEGGDLVHEEIFQNITGDLEVTWDLASKEQLALGDEVTMYASVYLGDIDAFAGDTSEFSQCAEAVTEPPATPTPTPPPVTPTPTPATPTPTATATPVATVTPTSTVTPATTATPAATPTSTSSDTLVQGDINCDGDIDEDDVLRLVFFVSEPIEFADVDCPVNIGDDEPISGFEWGDVNCDGAIDGLDALFVLLFVAELDTPEPAVPSCVLVGSAIT